MHGCYNAEIGNSKYYQWPIEAGLHGCEDDWIPLDHRDPSHPVHNFIKSTHEMRENYPVLQDGFSLQLLSNRTHDIFLPGSNHTPTETGLWSIERAGYSAIQQNLTQIAWLVFTNENTTINHVFACTSVNNALLAPFGAGSKIKNIYFPYDEYTLESSYTNMGKSFDSFPDQMPPARGCHKLPTLHANNIKVVARLYQEAAYRTWNSRLGASRRLSCKVSMSQLLQ